MTTPRNRSVFKAFAMLKAFGSAQEWLTSSELSRRAKLPEASGYRLIQTLEEIGAVVRGPSGRYRLGLLLVTLSQNVIVPVLVQDVSRQIAADLSRRINATVHVGVLERGMVTFVIRCTTATSFPSVSREGIQFEAYCSGVGKVLLAALPPEQLDAILDDELVALTPNTITDKTRLRRHLEEVRINGYALDEREFTPNLCCIAVPIRDHRGCAVAAISASEFATQMTDERRAELRAELENAAAQLSKRICPSGPAQFARELRSSTPRPANGDDYAFGGLKETA